MPPAAVGHVLRPLGRCVPSSLRRAATCHPTGHACRVTSGTTLQRQQQQQQQQNRQRQRGHRQRHCNGGRERSLRGAAAMTVGCLMGVLPLSLFKDEEEKEQQEKVPGVSPAAAVQQQLLDSVRPPWWTSELSAALDMYASVISEWSSQHSNNYPFVLNLMCAHMYQQQLEDEMARDLIKRVAAGEFASPFTRQEEEATLARAHHYVALSKAAYASDMAQAGIMQRHVLSASLGARSEENGVLRHVLLVDHLTKAVVLMIRGTADLHDVAADLCAQEIPFMGGVAHEGILHSARAVLDLQRNNILEALHAYPGYDLVLTGHSLGAGAALLATIIINEEWWGTRPRFARPVRAQCMAFAPPPVVSLPVTSLADHDRLLSFVRDSDAVPRASVYGLERMLAVWTEIDACTSFDFNARMESVYRMSLDKKVVRHVTERLPTVRADDTSGDLASTLLRDILEVTRRRAALPTEPQEQEQEQEPVPRRASQMFVPGRVCWMVAGRRVEKDTASATAASDAKTKTFTCVWMDPKQFFSHSARLLVGEGLGLVDHDAMRYREAIERLL